MENQMGDDVVWETLYQKAADLAAKVGVAPSVPRNAGRHRNQPNAPGVTLSQFWLVNIYFPFLDHLVTEIEDCLLQANPRYNTQRLIPTQVAQTNPTEAQCRDIYLYIGVLISKLLEDEDTFLHECVLWRTWWTDQTMTAQRKTMPDNLEDALKLTDLTEGLSSTASVMKSSSGF